MTEQEYVCLFLRKYGIIYKYYEMKMRDFMRIELEDENKKKQQEEHTCQQLSQKHESDLTKKEKRLLEKEKLKVL